MLQYPTPTILYSPMLEEPTPQQDHGINAPLPYFSHLPPSHIRGRNRWPLSLEAQGFPPNRVPALNDVLIWVSPYLEPSENSLLTTLATDYRHGPGYGPLWFYRPWSPHRRRRWGFGIPSINRTVVNDRPPPHLMIHFVWQYLDAADRYNMSRATKEWFLYQRLRAKAVRCPIRILLKTRPNQKPPKRLPEDRAILYASALLLFHFYYGDFVRWLGGEYTNRHRDWEHTFAEINERRERLPPIDYPPSDLHRGKRIFTQGAPLHGHFVCPQAEIHPRNVYNNHPAVKLNAAEVEEKFAKEEATSYHIHVPRFLVYFIIGLLLNPLQWEWDKGKGRICVDGTHGPDGSDTPGSCNTHIPKPSTDNPDECPPVYYSTALIRFLVAIWRLRITYPNTDILLHADDVKSAFRRILYSPEMAILFAYVFENFLIIPVGQVFGSRSAPSFFSLASDIRADLATTGTLVEYYPLQELASSIEFSPPPALGALAPAIADDIHTTLSQEEKQIYHNATFVDDNGICAIRDRMIAALHQSLVSAYILFGWPNQDRRSSCIAPEKWDNMATFVVLFLGYKINSRTMNITWPLYKREALYEDIQQALRNPHTVPPKVAASIMGKVRAAGNIAPWGPYISFSLADAIKHAT